MEKLVLELVASKDINKVSSKLLLLVTYSMIYNQQNIIR